MDRKLLLFLVESVAVGLVVGFLVWFFQPNSQVVHSYRHAVASAAPAVVSIYTTHMVLNRGESAGAGSGVIIDPRGYVLTSDHVIKNADAISVALPDGRSAQATVLGRDPETDLAVLNIDLDKLPVIRWGKEKVHVGDVVLAIGNPYGVGQTVTMGIVSGTGRDSIGISTFENFIQTDAAINPGNSGGALINTTGGLIGINTAVINRENGSEGIGFAIPGDLARDLMNQIIAHGKVSRGWLGIIIQDLTPELREPFGVTHDTGAIIAGIIKPGPAEAAGLHPGDIILKVDGRLTADSRSVLNRIAAVKPGNRAKITIVRGGQTMEIEATVSERPVQ